MHTYYDIHSCYLVLKDVVNLTVFLQSTIVITEELDCLGHQNAISIQITIYLTLQSLYKYNERNIGNQHRRSEIPPIKDLNKKILVIKRP